MLPPGTRLGHYEIVGPLGAGGMGEVYRARDSRLDRSVAIKIIPDSADRAAIARFEIEAHAASALNHPHIVTIFEFGRADTDGAPRDFIAMELIEGETLRDRIARQRELPPLLDLLIQIGDALTRAHQANIVHRDLKPENIMVTADGYAKILDFGLAKLLVGSNDSAAGTLVAPSVAGTFVGTIGYAAPEQLRGEAVDARSDIFSFGCVVYEAATSHRPFAGATALETAHQTATIDPPSLRSFDLRVPADLQRIVSRCLAKEPHDRYPSMRDVVGHLKRLREQLRATGARTLPRLSQLTFDKAVEQFPAISADGKRVVFSRDDGPGRKLFLIHVDGSGEEQITRGDDDDTQAAWSPSGDALLFVRSGEPSTRVEQSDVFGRFHNGNVWRLDMGNGKETMLASGAFNPSWSPDGRMIAFDASWSGSRRIWISDARGRNPQQLTSDTTDTVAHLRPRWSPDGKRIVFTNMEGTKFDVRVADVESKRMSWVTNDYTMDIHPVWSPDGESIFFSSYRAGGINVWRIPVDHAGVPVGAMEQITAGAGHDVDLDISASGRLVFATLRQNADIWRLPVDPHSGAATGAPEAVIAATRENSRGAWSPDGTSIAFNSDRGGEMNLWLLTADRKLQQLTFGAGGDFQPNWSPDSRALAFFSSREGGLDVWRLDLDDGRLTQLTRGEGLNLNPFFSPDGTRIAFQSDRDGALDVWVMNADGTNPQQLTIVGLFGHFLRWSHDGRWIYFRCLGGPKPGVLRVSASGGEPESAGEIMGGSHLSLSPDGSLMMDVINHKTLWVSIVGGGAPRKVFEFDDPDSRIDYPVWSPDGRWILFDRFLPHGGDIWSITLP